MELKLDFKRIGLGVLIGAVIIASVAYHNEKLSQAHTKGFVEGCANILSFTKQMATGQPLHPQEGLLLMQQCFLFKQEIEKPQPLMIEAKPRKEQTI